MKLLPDITKRAFSVDEAAEYCGVSRATLSRHGPPAAKIGKRRKIYDRRVLDAWLDRLARLDVSDGPLPIERSENRHFEIRKIPSPRAIKGMVNARRQARRRETQALLKSLWGKRRDGN